MRLELPYGTRPYSIDLDGREVTLVRPPDPPPGGSLDSLLRAALDAPIAGPRGAALPEPLRAALAGHSAPRVTLIVSDPSRNEPREGFVTALRRWLPGARWTIAIATGTHGPCQVDDLGLSPSSLRDATIINHDGHCGDDLVELGRTAHGTPVRVHRCLVDADLVIATGCIRPHYFAGFGAGIKAMFPGLGEASAIRINHRLKTELGSRAGVIDGNPCRADLEEASTLIPVPAFLVNGVCAPDDVVHAVVAGDVIAAFRAGAERARPWFTVRAPASSLVIASDAHPVTASLYQAAKIAAAAAPVVAPGGTLLIVAECSNGVGPLEVVNEAIFRIGVLPRLAPGVRLVLVSSLDEAVTKQTLVGYAPSVESVLATTPGPVTVMPRASQLICELAS